MTGLSQKHKLQRGGIEVFVKHKARRPHEYVLAGDNKKCDTYNQLAMDQWMAGFCRAMREETNQIAVLLCCMMHGEVKDFTETKLKSTELTRHKGGYVQRHVFFHKKWQRLPTY